MTIYRSDAFPDLFSIIDFAARNPGAKFLSFSIELGDYEYVTYDVNQENNSFTWRRVGLPDHYIPPPKDIHLSWFKPRFTKPVKPVDPAVKAILKRRKAKKLQRKQKR